MGKDVCEKKTVLFGCAVAVYIPSFLLEFSQLLSNRWTCLHERHIYIYILSVMLQVFVDTSAYTQNLHTHKCPFQFAKQKNYCTHGGAGSMSMLTGRRVEIAIV